LPNLLKSVTNIRKNNPQLKKKAFWCTFHPFVVPTYHNTSHLLTMCKIQITDQRNED
jgi:hypothetical protein